MRGLQRLPPSRLGVSGGRVGAAVCYPTLQKTLVQLGGKDQTASFQLFSDWSFLGPLLEPEEKSWWELLPLGHLGWSQGGTWGRDRQPGCAGLGPQCCALTVGLLVPGLMVLSPALPFSLTTWAGPGFGPTPSLQLQSLLLNMDDRAIVHSLGEA